VRERRNARAGRQTGRSPQYGGHGKKAASGKKTPPLRRSAQEREIRPENQIEGRNPVKEALLAGRPIRRLMVADKEQRGPIAEIIAMARERRIPIDEVSRATLDFKSATGTHQGVIAIAAAKEYADLDAVLAAVGETGETPLLLICDGLQDPHNLGALLRTADAAGAHAVVIPARRSVGLTATVAKTSAGAIEHVPVCRVTNINQTVNYLKEQRLWVVGADMNAEQDLWEADLSGPLAIVVGGEDTGISRLVAENCDFLVRMPMQGAINSLNASVAGSIMLYEALHQRLKRS
jgi:23S rRNA (guanosine2251-2'-O)-methyltransferase